TVQDGGSSTYRIRVLVPAEGLGGFVPEPVTVAGLAFGVASLGGYLRRRRVG
ncbi:MAG: PEP-CTERM sorting domain-containing protein, partial [Acidobacteria bacterium]|nr:PEP-CTERM sorting domain-containing protein [Acidobacteriota bacterium]